MGTLETILFVNAIVSFLVFFGIQILLIFKFEKLSGSSWVVHDPGLDLQNGSDFLTGKRFPRLRRYWLRSLIWVVTSYALLFAQALIFGR